MANVCGALSNWASWTDDQRSGYLEDLIQDQMKDWGCQPIADVTFDSDVHDGVYDPNTRTIKIKPECKEFLQSGGGVQRAQECSVIALHEAGHGLVDCFGVELNLPLEQIFVEALAWLDYWDAAHTCEDAPSESAVSQQMWKKLKWFYNNPGAG